MSDAMLRLSSTGDALAAIARGAAIDVHAYTLHGAVERALKGAAERGAHVAVELDGHPYDDPKGRLAAENARVAADLRSAGVDARLASAVHAKTIRADGALFLDDKNWGARDLVLRADAADGPSIASIKHAALAQEAGLLRDAGPGGDVIVATESFGRFNAVYAALDDLAKVGASPRLVVSARDLRHNDRERAALETLAGEGVRVRVCDDSEKLAAAGDAAWVGSANATVAFGRADLPDWGVCTDDAAIVHAVRERAESEWARGRDIPLRYGSS